MSWPPSLHPGAFGLEAGEATLGGTTLRWAACGEGPLVLLLHGFPESWLSWKAQMEALAAAGYRAVAPMQRGYPGSDRPSRVDAYHIDHLVADIEALRVHLGAETFHLVGHDWGAIVAWFYAMKHPERLHSLSILNVPHPGHMPAMMRDADQIKMSWYIGFFQLPWLPEYLLLRRKGDALKRTLCARRIRSTVDQGALQAVVDAFQRDGIRTALHWYRALGRLGPRGVRARLAPMSVPTLVLWGERDIALHVKFAVPPASLVSNATVQTFPQASHWLQGDLPDEVNEALLRHLDAQPPR